MGYEGGVSEGTSNWRDASTMGGRTSDWGDASRMGGGTSSWGDACEMGAGISGLVTTRGVVTRRPRPLTTLVLRLAIARWPWPLAVLGLGFTVAHQPRLGVRRVAVLVHGVVVVVDSVSCLLFACPFATGPPPSPTIAFGMRRTWLCLGLPTGSISNSALWFSIWNRERTSTIRFETFMYQLQNG